MDPVADSLDRYFHEQEEREAADILEEVATYVADLQKKVDACDRIAGKFEALAEKGGPGSRNIAVRARVARANAQVMHDILTKLKTILDR